MKQFSQGMEQERGSMIRENKFELDFIKILSKSIFQ